VVHILPKVIIHNSVSLDGSLTNFEVNLPLHYQIAGGFGADMHLVGSTTARTGMELFLTEIPEETDSDLRKPDRGGILWAIPDSGGKLQGLLHVFRQSDYCRDVVILVSRTTPGEYIRYLEERRYDHFVVGEDKCDLKLSLELLQETYRVTTILTDTGSVLSNLLIRQGLVAEISLLVHPEIVGAQSYNMFRHLDHPLDLNLVKKEFFEGGYLWLLYTLEP
jgi:2,5-diamino-6-(ribosylamino)-4(3H)-pyrimidinone 5'-phosphate reductase